MPYHLRFLLLLLSLVALAVSAEVTVTDLRVENMESPLGLDTNQPRFSWKIVSDEQNVVQTAYEITVESGGHTLWNSGRVESREQLWITYGGVPLRSGQYCEWTLCDNVNDNDNPNANVNDNVNPNPPRSARPKDACKARTLNPQHSALHAQHSTLHAQHSSPSSIHGDASE
ncbi:MAG: hypothetical protein IJP46_04225 [Prevotella sp.]|nr:hypothetical protein [Prevotella sp.]